MTPIDALQEVILSKGFLSFGRCRTGDSLPSSLKHRHVMLRN
jgi:hypothetical protein